MGLLKPGNIIEPLGEFLGRIQLLCLLYSSVVLNTKMTPSSLSESGANDVLGVHNEIQVADDDSWLEAATIGAYVLDYGDTIYQTSKVNANDYCNSMALRGNLLNQV